MIEGFAKPADRCVEALTIAATGQDTNPFHDMHTYL